MKNLWSNILKDGLVATFFLWTAFAGCGTDKNATSAALPEVRTEKVSPNNAPDQRVIDSLKQIETHRKQYDSTATEK